MKKLLQKFCLGMMVFMLGFTGSYAGNYLSRNQGEKEHIKTTAHPVVSSQKQAESLEDVVTTVKDSVVEIETESVVTDFWGKVYANKGAGSGVLISKDGYLLTNHHVVAGAEKVLVRTTDGQEYDARVVKASEQQDLALLKIESNKELTYAKLRQSEEAVLGEAVIAIGNPLGTLGGTVTDGVISALDRRISIDGNAMNLLQTSAAINKGNSGGGLFDRHGELLGIVVAKSGGVSVEGLGFVIPIKNVLEFLGEYQSILSASF